MKDEDPEIQGAIDESLAPYFEAAERMIEGLRASGIE